jgi:hypothetical protein
LHPLRDDLATHIRENESTGRLQGIAATGRFHIEVLRLNRPALIVHRQKRALAVLLEARPEQALAENKALQERLPGVIFTLPILRSDSLKGERHGRRDIYRAV